MPLKITKTTEKTYVTGNTFPLKETLKTLGGQWEPATKSWTFPPAFDAAPLRAAEAALYPPVVPRLPAYGWCCSNAKLHLPQGDHGPSHVRCPDHGDRPLTKKGWNWVGD